MKRFIVSDYYSSFNYVEYCFPTKKEALNKYNELVDNVLCPHEVTLICEETLTSTHYDLEGF